MTAWEEGIPGSSLGELEGRLAFRAFFKALVLKAVNTAPIVTMGLRRSRRTRIKRATAALMPHFDPSLSIRRRASLLPDVAIVYEVLLGLVLALGPRDEEEAMKMKRRTMKRITTSAFRTSPPWYHQDALT